MLIRILCENEPKENPIGFFRGDLQSVGRACAFLKTLFNCLQIISSMFSKQLFLLCQYRSHDAAHVFISCEKNCCLFVRGLNNICCRFQGIFHRLLASTVII